MIGTHGPHLGREFGPAAGPQLIDVEFEPQSSVGCCLHQPAPVLDRKETVFNEDVAKRFEALQPRITGGPEATFPLDGFKDDCRRQCLLRFTRQCALNIIDGSRHTPQG